MQFIVVNLDKKEYVRPIALGAPPCSKREDLIDDYGPYDWQWLIPLVRLLERPGSQPHIPYVQPPLFSWGGDRLIILRGDDASDLLIPEEMQALIALGASPTTSYKYVRENFKDRTQELKNWWLEKDIMTCRIITHPRDFSWLTPGQLRTCIEHARHKGSTFLRTYVSWLKVQSGVRPEVMALLEKVQEVLKKDPTLTTLASVFSDRNMVSAKRPQSRRTFLDYLQGSLSKGD